jgi:hypothetical protein
MTGVHFRALATGVAILGSVHAGASIAGGPAGADDVRLNVAVGTGHQRYHAAPGSSALKDPEFGVVVTDGVYPLYIRKRLEVRAGTAIAIDTGTEATAVRLRVKDARSEELSAPWPAARAHAADGRPARHWLARLPGQFPSRTDRIGVAVDYPDGSTADFEAGLRFVRR